MKNIPLIVKTYLEEYKSTRDNFDELVYKISNCEDVEPTDVLKIDRERRLLQSKHKELRWEKWNERQKYAKKVWENMKIRGREMPEELIINKTTPKIQKSFWSFIPNFKMWK